MKDGRAVLASCQLRTLTKEDASGKLDYPSPSQSTCLLVNLPILSCVFFQYALEMELPKSGYATFVAALPQVYQKNSGNFTI